MDDESAGLIALSADGSFRDAQGALDQLISLGEKKITGDVARQFLSVPPREIIENFITAMLEKDEEKGLGAIQKMVEKNIDVKIFLKLILRDVRSAILLRLAPNMRRRLEGTHGEREFGFIERFSKTVKKGELERALKILLEAYDARGRSYLPQTPLELAFLKIVGQNE